ncbi:hypothetical protein Syun_006095 [Stephania yunnanensis]|uniref:Uncharacterized protein n=1 Tax=Stephania yunnanensis TaxID=152371 RepID=A0AAP0KXL6_9MAGN
MPPKVDGDITAGKDVPDTISQGHRTCRGSFLPAQHIQGVTPMNESLAAQQERTMFMTFSRGYRGSKGLFYQDFYAFHTIDRELFTRLVIDLRRDPGYSMLSLALFLWFNNIGFPDVVVKLRSLPDAVVDVVGEEATIILRYLETGTLPPSAQPNALENLIPTIRGLMDSRLTFQFLQEQRIRVLNGVSQFMEDVCSRAFVDIVQRLAVIREREAASTSVGNQPFVMPTNFGVRPPVVPPMAPAVPPRYVVIQDPMVPQMGVAPMNESLAAQQERTMFMTFSRGYPVSEAEVRDYFTRYV